MSKITIKSAYIFLFLIGVALIIVVANKDDEEDVKLKSSSHLLPLIKEIDNDENENKSIEPIDLFSEVDNAIRVQRYEERQVEIEEKIEKQKEEDKKREKELEEQRKAEEAARLAEIEEEKKQQEAEEQEQIKKEEEKQERLAQEEASEEKEEDNQDEVAHDVSEQNEDFIEEFEQAEEKIVEDEVPAEKESSNTDTYVVTAYTAGAESTDKNPGDSGYGVTASGSTVQEGHTIACPPELSFGTEVHIPDMGTTYTCKDRGADIQGNRLDVYMSDLGQAQNFGRQEMEVEVR